MRTVLLVLALAHASPALAGPGVPKAMMADVPQETAVEGAAMEETIAGLDERVAAREQEADRLRGSVKTLKIDLKTAKAEVSAEKAQRKAAKKAKDREAMAAAEDRMAAAEDRVAQLESDLATADVRADLMEAQAKLLKAERDVTDAKLQLMYARSVSEQHPELDVNRYEATLSKAELDYQSAREKAALAEARVSARTKVQAAPE